MPNGNDPLHVVVGCNGPVGLELMRLLDGRGVRVRGLCRSGRAEAPDGVEVLAVDIGDARGARDATADAEVIYSCVGVDYTRWRELWPPIVDGLLTAASGKKLVFADNLYSYGPVTEPMTEDLPLTGYGTKPALRARMTETLLGAHAEQRLAVALVRASDFYGPGVTNSMLGERVFPMALAGRPAQTIGDPDQPHSFTYVPDFALGLATVADSDDAWGEIWHVPNAAAMPLRQVVERVFQMAGHVPRLRAMPLWLVKVSGLFSPLMRELDEMRFVWDRPYIVDDTKFRRHFGLDPTPLERGLDSTLRWYREQRAARTPATG